MIKPEPPPGRLVGVRSKTEQFMIGVAMFVVAIMMVVLFGSVAYLCIKGFDCIHNH